MKILVTGADGQLGHELRVAAATSADCYLFTDAAQLDICDADAVESFVEREGVDVIINCAAFTAVERAEQEPVLCDVVNHLAVKSLAQIAHRHNAMLIHISTDFVFDGRATEPYTEQDSPAPLNCYGRSKLAGERAVIASGARYVILRTGWLYSSYGSNFLRTILRLADERDTITVVDDQRGTPTYAADLAKFIVYIITSGKIDSCEGLYHYANMGECTWCGFAQEILRLTESGCRVVPCSTSEYPTKVCRPQYSVLDKGLVQSIFGVDIPHWQLSLAQCIEQLKTKL